MNQSVLKFRDDGLLTVRDDIYFLIEFSCRGAQEKLTRGREDLRTTMDLIINYCTLGTHMVSNIIPVEQVK